MPRYHTHDELEINVVVRGHLDYLFGGERHVIPEGHTGLFWAAAPHRLIGPEPGTDDDIVWVMLPLGTVLKWSLPAEFSSVVMTQRTVIVPTAAIGSHVVAMLATWQRDLDSDASHDALWHEAAALLTRILSTHADRATSPSLHAPQDSRVATMARYVAEHFREPISTAEVAEAAGLTRGYATTLFRRSVGLTVGEQVRRHRIAEAQRLLATSSMTTESIAHAAGFGSSSSFYDHFARACGTTPGQYRASRSSSWSEPRS